MYKGITAANVITGSRLGFFVVFVWAAHMHIVEWVVAMFVLAWGLDAVDGWVARKMGQTTSFGYIFDKAVDRVVVFVGLMVLLVNGLVPDYALLILVKDIAILPVVSVQLGVTKAIVGMGRVGKIAATAQGIAIIWMLMRLPAGLWIVGLVAGFGAVVGMRHLYRIYYGDGVFSCS